jgi:hypothetical protein
LQHHRDVAQIGIELREMEQQRRRYVVRQVADDAQLAAQRREVEGQRVGDVQREPLRRKFGGERGGEIAIDLDDGQSVDLRQQRAGQRAETRADFDETLAALRRDRSDDAIDVMRIGQKMLAESFARPVRGYRQCPAARACDTRSIARSTAANSEPGSAARASAPSAARSSAVPWSTDVRTNGRPSVTLTASPKPSALSTGKP